MNITIAVCDHHLPSGRHGVYGDGNRCVQIITSPGGIDHNYGDDNRRVYISTSPCGIDQNYGDSNRYLFIIFPDDIDHIELATVHHFRG